MVAQERGLAVVPPTIGLVATPLTEADWHERKQLMRETMLRNASPAEVDNYIVVCRTLDFDPILNHVNLIDHQVYITHKGLLHAAHRSGHLDGIELLEVGETETHYTARVAVHRDDMKYPFTYPGRYPKSGRNKQYGTEMAITRAECMALRRAFDLALPVAEEINWASGDAPEMARFVAGVDPAPIEASAAPSLGPGPKPKLGDLPDERLLALLADEAQDAKGRYGAAHYYLARATDAASLNDRHAALAALGWSERRKLYAHHAERLGVTVDEPGAYQRHPREDQQDILGDSPDARLAMLGRIRAAMATAGKTPEEVNAFVYATWKQPAIETLSADEAEELIAILEARGEEDAGAAPAEEPKRYIDDNDDVPF